MKQKQAKPEGGKPESADTMAGNKVAEMMGAKAKAAIEAVSKAQAVSSLTPSVRLARIDEYLKSAKSLPNVEKLYGGKPLDIAAQIAGCNPPTARKILELIKDGKIDEDTMRWTDQDRLICVCLAFGCTIGPFIPFRE